MRHNDLLLSPALATPPLFLFRFGTILAGALPGRGRSPFTLPTLFSFYEGSSDLFSRFGQLGFFLTGGDYYFEAAYRAAAAGVEARSPPTCCSFFGLSESVACVACVVDRDSSYSSSAPGVRPLVVGALTTRHEAFRTASYSHSVSHCQRLSIACRFFTTQSSFKIGPGGPAASVFSPSSISPFFLVPKPWP